MRKIIRLTESDLTRIVKRVIKENESNSDDILNERPEKKLNESKNYDKLYHYTVTLSNLISILKEDKLKANIHNYYYQNDIRYLTKSKNLRREKIKNEPIKPHVSFTRVKNFNRKTPLLLIIDGEKLSNNNKINPYSMDYGMKNMKKRTGFIGHEEFEERIYGDINNLSRYLDRIEIDFGWYNYFNRTNDELVDNVNKCIEIKKLFPNTIIFGSLKIKTQYKPDILKLIGEEFNDVTFN